MKDCNCIFCKIAAGEIPSRTLYEDDSFRVILDISPASKGHAIILPKNHAANIYEISEEDAGKIFVVAKKVAAVMKDVLHCDGMNILQNNGEVAGQTVFHLHVHLIPRYEGDQLQIKWTPQKMGDELLEELAQEIQKAFL